MLHFDTTTTTTAARETAIALNNDAGSYHKYVLKIFLGRFALFASVFVVFKALNYLMRVYDEQDNSTLTPGNYHKIIIVLVCYQSLFFARR